MSGSGTLMPPGQQVSSSPRGVCRRVTTAFEAWDASLGMVVIMNSGLELRLIGIVLNKALGPGLPSIPRAVEFESNGACYVAAFERLRKNTSFAGRRHRAGKNTS